MKRILIVVLSAGIVIFFGASVWYAYVHKRGVPAGKPSEPQKVLLQVPFDFVCTVWCSRHHLSMKGKITVE